MKTFTQKFIGLLALVFAISFTANAQDNYSLSFYDNNARVEIPSSDTDFDFYGKSHVSICAWVKLSSHNQTQTIFLNTGPSSFVTDDEAPNMHQQYGVKINTEGKIYFLSGAIGNFEPNGQANSGFSLVPIDEWVHIAFTYDSSHIRLYLNGELDFEREVYDIFPDEHNNVAFIGTDAHGTPFDGNINQVQVWDKALNVDEIQSYINCPPIGTEDELVGYWYFDEGSGNTVYDISGNGNNGVIHGATYSEDTPQFNCPLGTSESLNNGLVAYYPFDGNANDESGNGNHGTVNGATLSIDRFEQLSAYEFNESSIEINNQFFNNGWESYSISCWFMTNNISKLNQTILNTIPHNGEGLSFNHFSAHDKLAHFKNALIETSAWSTLYSNDFYNDIEQDTWYFVTIVKDAMDFHYYVNGNFQKTTTITEENHSGQGAIVFGNISDEVSNPEYLNGKLDDIGIWNRALSENEVLELYLQLDGCTDALAFNYNENATQDDGSCYPMIYGCINPIAANYVSPIGDVQIDVNTDDGSCIYSSDVYDNILEELSVFETVEEEQDYSMSFDGVDDFIDVGNLDIISTGAENEYTVSFWFNLKSMEMYHQQYVLFGDEYSQNNGILFQMHQEWGFGAYTTGDQFNETHYSGFIPSLDVWNFYTVVQDASGIHFYLNGNYQYYLGEDLNSETSQPTLIGKHTVDTRFLNGEMNNISTFNRALSEEEIQSYMTCPLNGSEEGVVGYWDFNEVSGDTVYDMSGNGNHGIINGALLSEDVPESYNGCTDANALNFNESALCDNGSCVYGDDVVSNLEDSIYNTISSLIECSLENEELFDNLSLFETVEEEQNYSLKLNDSQVLISDNLTFSSNNGLSFLLNVKMTNLNQQHFIDIGEAIGVENYLRYVIKYENGLIQAWMEGPGWGSSGGQSHLNHEIEGLSDAWIKIGVTFDNSASKLYIDGVLVDTKEYNYSENIQIVSSPNSIISGNNFQSEGYRFNGSIEDLQIWGTTLSNDEIQSYITCPPTGNEENLVAYWNFNEGSGNTVYDLSGNGNNGIIYEGYVGGPNNAEFSEDVPESNNGCTDVNALNYDTTAQCDNGSCVYGDDEYSAIGLDLDNTNSTLNNVLDTWQSSVDLTNSTLGEVSLINQTLNSFNTVIDLTEGWNMFGYGCPQPMSVSEGLSNYTDLIIITKDNYGNVYMPEFGFNGIGTFSPGYGYQIKISEAIEGFSLCGDFINTDNTQILDIETDNAQMQNDINCLTGNPEIGDYCYGGIVFYVEEGEEGKYGLVAALEDLDETYEWGCYGSSIDGADDTAIGSGYQNTLDIITGCTETPIAASAALDYESEVFDDWFLPSFDELLAIRLLCSENTQFASTFDAYWYYSSSEQDDYDALIVQFPHGDDYDTEKWGADGRVRPIRAFGYTLGCMDSLACNFNTEANMADGSCTYSEEGYDCDGNINVQVGDEAFGGIVFYVDESGEHGLVANINDIDGVYEEIGDNNGYLWGCFDGQSTDVPFNILSTEIGYGEYNTNEIIEYCQEENIAAKLADSFEDNTYTDWYLPSLGELSILCYVHSENSNKFNYDSRGFWTSSYNLSSYSPYFIDFYNSTSPGIYNLNCSEHFHPHNTIRGVIPIRSF